MMFPSLALFSGFALLSSAVASTTWQVTVGNATGGTIYTPNNITAAVGDTVMFTFNPKNHSVTQSTFGSPCTHKTDGFDSLFHPVANITSDLPTFMFTVNDTNPIWVYCRQSENTAASHCGKGMVFAVNPGAEGSNNSFSNFLAAAKAVGASLSSSAVSSTAPSTASSTAPSTALSTAWSTGTPTSVIGKGSNPTTSGQTSSTASANGGSTTPGSTASNGAISLNVGGPLLVTVVGMVFGFLA